MVTGGFPLQRSVTRSFDFFFSAPEQRDAGDLRRQRALCNVTVRIRAVEITIGSNATAIKQSGISIAFSKHSLKYIILIRSITLSATGKLRS